MKILDLRQGTPGWLAARATHRCASEAPAMMGVSHFQTRSQLLATKASGVAEVIDSATQERFDRGHAAEAAARPLIEEMILDELHPITATDDDDYLLASCDGLTMDESTLYEHKLYNAGLIAAIAAEDLPPAYYWQLEQQLLVTGAERVIFVCSDGTRDTLHWMEYRAVPGRARALLDGWRQFDADLAAFKPTDDAPRVTGASLIELPALDIRLAGNVLSSNLAYYQSKAIDFIDAIKTDLQTDQDFADAESAVKFCERAEKELEDVKRRALASTASIDEVFRTLDVVKAALRAKRLTVDKLVTSRKVSIRAEIAEGGRVALVDHIAGLSKRLGRSMPYIAISLVDVMKGKRTVASLRNAVDTEVARVKIFANAMADVIDANQKRLAELSAGFEFLFRDADALTEKAADDLEAVVKQRIADHQAAEEKRKELAIEQTKPAAAVPAPIATPSPTARTTPPLGAVGRMRADLIAVLPRNFTDEDRINHIGAHGLEWHPGWGGDDIRTVLDKAIVAQAEQNARSVA